MKDRTLIGTAAVGGALAAICCATPLLAIILGTLGFSAWIVKADTILIPVLLICLGLLGLGLYRRATARACCDPASSEDTGP